MKQTLRLLARFVFISLLLILALSSLVVLSRYVIGYDPEHARAVTLLVQLLDAVQEVFVISLVMSGGISLFGILRRAEQPFLPLVVLGVSWTALLVLSALLLPVNRGTLNSDGPAVPEGRVIQVSGAHLYTPEVTGLSLSPLVVHRVDEIPGLEFFREGTIDPEQSAILFPGHPDLSLGLAEIASSYPAMVATPEQLEPLVRDVDALNRLLLNTEPNSESAGRRNLLLAFALGFFVLSCWTPARTTRWPLFNAILVFLCLRGALWLVSSLHFGELGKLIGSAVRPDQIGLVSAGVLAFVGVVFIVALLLMPPFSNWKREVSGG